MAAPVSYSYTNTYQVGRGKIGLDLLVNGKYQGFRWIGNCPGFTINIESENLTHQSSEGGLSETDLDVPLSITRSATITVDNFSAENLAIFLAATVGSADQTSSTVTNELVSNVHTNRFYQLGEQYLPTGVRGISAVTVDVYAPARANSTAYAVGDMYLPATPNDHVYICTVAGTSDSTPPTFDTSGGTFSDGTATFQDLGAVNALADGPDYVVDTALGIVSILSTGKIAAVYDAAVAAVGAGNFDLRLHVDYTRPASSRVQLATGSAAAVEGKLRFIADNPIGANRDVYMPSVTIRPSGELPMISEGDVASVQFSVGIGVLNSTTAAIYIDERPVS